MSDFVSVFAASAAPARERLGHVASRRIGDFVLWMASLALVCACGGRKPIAPPRDGGAPSGMTGGGTAGSAGGGTAGIAPNGSAGAATAGASGGVGGGGAGTGGAAGAPSVQVAACSNYCDVIMTSCTGVNQQYADKADCMKVCSYLPLGAPTDTGVNSIGCRTNAAQEAKTGGSTCLGAGPLSDGYCGEDCAPFCAIATQYCTAAGGYKGTPPYASISDCLDTCGQFARQLEVGMPGSYRAAFTPGTTSETQDTLECRAFHLFIDALRYPADQQTACQDAANVSPACGPGTTAITIPDAGAIDVGVCSTYCATIMKNCTGANQQYIDLAGCMRICRYIPVGMPTDSSVETVGCKLNIARAANGDATTVRTNCLKAGPVSYDSCGDDCSLYCTAALDVCKPPGYTGPALYKSHDDCMTICAQFNRAVDFNAPGTFGASYMPGATPETHDTFECRAYYLYSDVLGANMVAACNYAGNGGNCGLGVPTTP
jgi:hypothetical protein